MKRIAIIGTAGVPGRYGGFETLAHNLVLRLNKSFRLVVYNSTRTYPKEERKKEWNGARIVYIPLSANGIQSILYDIISMIHALFTADILLILGVSGGIFIPFLRLFSNKKIVVNIDGLEWRRNKWSKPVKKFLHFSEMMAVKFSHATITDNESIQKYAGRFYQTTNTLIAYGADHTGKVKKDAELLIRYPFLRKPYAFSVARIEPENNVHLILEAFAKIPEQTLVYVGNWNNSPYGRELKSKYAQYPNIHLLAPVYDQETLDKMRSNCKIYVHGHSAGGTNPSLVEAMYLGLPVMAFDVSYNRSTTKEKALYFKTSGDLVRLVETTPKTMLISIGEIMKYIARMEYTWDIIAGRYKSILLAFEYEYHKKPIRSWLSGLPEKMLIDNGLGHLKYQKYYYE